MPEDTNAPVEATEAQTDPGSDTPEVDLSDYIPKSVFNAEMAKMRTKMKGLADPDKLLEDESFRERALETWEVNTQKGKKADPSQDQIEAIAAKLRKTEVEPLAQEREALLSEVTALRTTQLTSQLVQAATGVISPALLKPPVPGAEPPIVNLLRPYFGFDEDSREWFVKDGDGFAYSGTPKEGALYKGVEEFLADWASDPNNKDFIVDSRQRGPNLAGTGSTRGPRRIEIARDDARDHQKYTAAKAKADELGVDLVII